MGQQHAFRLARGPRRVGLTRHVVVRPVDDCRVVVDEKRLERGRTVGVAEAHDRLDRRLVTDLLDDRHEVGERDDDFRAAVVEQVADLAGFVLRVHRDHDRTRPERAVETHDELREVRQVDPDAVPGFDPRFGESGGELPYLGPELPIAQVRPIVVDRGRVRMIGHGGLDVGHEIRHGFP